MMTRHLRMSAFVMAGVLAMGISAIAADSNLGTWKMNPAKSKFDGVKYTADGMDGDGKPSHWEMQAKYDGKFVPFKGNPDADMLAYKRIDANTVEATTQLNGKVMGKSRIVVSADGKTRTLTQTGKNAKGQDVHNTVVYEKQ
jgi:hypothetical protein